MENVRIGHERPVVCLDAGHYGKYNASPVVPGYFESEMNWKLQMYLKEALQSLGIVVHTTRNNIEKDMELVERGRMSKNCDLFISLHSNASSNPKTDYALTLYQVKDNCGEMDVQSLRFAAKIGRTISQVMCIPWKTWASESQYDRDRNGYKDDYYGVLRGAHNVGTPGVIVEHGFHTHKETTVWLMNDENLKSLAKAEAQTIAQWFDWQSESEPKSFTVKIPYMYYGHKGTCVKALQQLLIANGYDCGKFGADGIWGKATEKALEEYQQAKNLESDRIFGPLTFQQLFGLDLEA